MKKIIRDGLLLMMLITSTCIVKAGSNMAVVNSMFISNSTVQTLLNSVSPGPSVETITNKDEMIFYYADIGIINPTKIKYDIDVVCIDSKGNTIIKGSVQRKLTESIEHIGGDTIKRLVQTVGLDSKSGAMVSGQLIPLKNGNNYFIKLFVEKKLIGVTKFNYLTVK